MKSRETPSGTDRRCRRTMLAAGAILGIVALSATGCTEAPQVQPPPPPSVTVATPEVRDVVPVHEFSGTTDAFQSVEIRARVQGFLDEIRFQASEFVERGRVLFVIEQEPYIARRDRAQANIASAEAVLRRTESDLERLEQAVRTNAVSQQEVTRARAERDQAEAALGGARSELENAQIELEYTTIETPVTGLVSRNLVDLGNLVGPNTNALLATVRRLDPIFAYFEVNERFFARMLEQRGGHREPGEGPHTPAVLVVPETGERIEGNLDSIDNAVDPGTGTIMVRGVFPNADATVFPGFFVTILLSGDVLEDAIVIHERAIGTDLSGKFVLVVGEDNVVERRRVNPGPTQDDGTIVITEGLDVSDRYIVEGVLRARPGMPVDPTTATDGGGR